MAVRTVLSRAATRRKDGRVRKVMFIDARIAHLNPRCEEDVYIELPEECGAPPGMCGKLKYWLYGFRQAASAWEKFYSELLEEAGFRRGQSCGVVFFHKTRDWLVTVHGDDFTCGGLQEDLVWLKELMESWFEIKFRGILGLDAGHVREI